MKVFVNCLVNYGATRDTDLNVPRHMGRLRDHARIDVGFNQSRFQPWMVRACRRLTTTRFAGLAKKLPTHTVLIPSWQVASFDVAYHYNLAPRYVGPGRIPPSILSTHWQTDRVLESFGVKDIGAFWKRYAEGERRYDAYMVSTRFAVPRFQEVLKGVIDHVHYCPFFLPNLNPIDDRTLNAKSKSDNVRLLFVGRDGARKGIATLLKALDSLSVATARQLEVDVVTETQLDALPKNLSAFRYHARLANDKTVELMRDAHVFCLPTLSDVYGVVFVEALSQGCAVIADNDLTRLEIIQENKAGFCVDPTDREQLANAMEQLVSDRAQLVRCMNSAKRAFDQHFAADVTARRHEQIFREMIKRGRRNG